MEINVCSFNAENKYKIKRYDGAERPEKLSNYIKGNNGFNEAIDIIGMQEVRIGYLKKLLLFLTDFSFTGKFRQKIRLQERTDEANIILVNNKMNIMASKTIWLSPKIQSYTNTSYMSLLPRIANVTYAEYLGRELAIVNTHLHYKGSYSRIKQLAKLSKLLKKINEQHPTSILIVMGDFNLTPNSPFLNDFIEKHASFLKIVDNEVPTRKNKHLDYIFYSYKYVDLVNVKVDNINISDHNPVLAKFHIKD